MHSDYAKPVCLHNAKGQVRRVGFELEFAGLDLKTAAAVLAQAVQGEMRPLHADALIGRSGRRQRKERDRNVEQRAIGALHRVMAFHAAHESLNVVLE